MIKQAPILLGLCSLLAAQAVAQIHDMREMATLDIRGLDLERTVIIIPEGILEEHGPYLPSYTDGYRNEYFSQRVAESTTPVEATSRVSSSTISRSSTLRTLAAIFGSIANISIAAFLRRDRPAFFCDASTVGAFRC